MRNRTLNTVAMAIAIFLTAVAFSASADAGSLREGATGSGSAVTGALPGQVLWTYYQTADVANLSYSTAFKEYAYFVNFPGGAAGRVVVPAKLPSTPVTVRVGKICSGSLVPYETTFSCPADNIIRLTNPNGGANGNLAGADPQTVCAMIYVFDDDEEMGECCGCPLSSAQLATFSVENNLTANWGLAGGPEAGQQTNGAIAVVATAPNGPGSTCNPTNLPGYSVTNANNLLGSVTNSQTSFVPLGRTTTLISVSGGDAQNFVANGPKVGLRIQPAITETALSDDAGGDPTNLTYLQNQCGALIGNGTGGGICNCPTE
jgi:hypothetical protein